MEDGDLAPVHPLAHVVVGLALQRKLHPGGEEGPEGLPGAAREAQAHRAFREPGVAVAEGDRAGQPGPCGALAVPDGQERENWLPPFQGRQGQG